MRRLLPVSLIFFSLFGSAYAQSPTLPQSAANDPAQAGRQALYVYLNTIAFRETAARRAVIASIHTRAQAEARQRKIRATMLRLLGSLPTRIPLNPRTTGSTQLDGFRVDKVLFDSQPNFPITALLYVPSAALAAAKFPVIVMAPGHSPAGKAGDVAMATQFARAGFVVLSYDPIGQGERLQYLDPKSPANKPQSFAGKPTGEHGEAGLQPTLLGDALARYFLWDGMRAVDYLQSLPFVDPKRIGAFGCSGGGTMTAMLAALDTRIAATGVACYTTSWDALLTSATGVQDSEQSTPNWIASGLDFPDWSELAAPRPYAIIATTADMFPFAGAQATEAEARKFYGLFGADKDLAFITGPGGHGNLRPITPQILHFFTDHLKPDPAFAKNLPTITDPFDDKANPPRKPGDRSAFPPPPPASLVQVTPTGQLSSSYPNIATVFTLNRERAATVITPHPQSLAALQRAVRSVTHAEVLPKPMPRTREPGKVFNVSELGVPYTAPDGSTEIYLSQLQFTPEASGARGFLVGHENKGPHDGILVLTNDLSAAGAPSDALKTKLLALAQDGTVVLALQPRPSPTGTEETKSALLGPFYLSELRTELVGRTLMGLRIDDVLQATNYLHALLQQYALKNPGASENPIREGETADPHLALVLLHAAVLDLRIRQVRADNFLASYRTLTDQPLPQDAPQDVLPSVLRSYDIPDLVHALGPRFSTH